MGVTFSGDDEKAPPGSEHSNVDHFTATPKR
jgi:hypothetical protein